MMKLRQIKWLADEAYSYLVGPQFKSLLSDVQNQVER